MRRARAPIAFSMRACARYAALTLAIVAGASPFAIADPPATAAPPAPPPPGDPGPLPLSPGGPTLVVADGPRIESIDPETGKVLGAIAPVRLPGFAWARFLRRGRFLLADGRAEPVPGPQPYYLRGLALIDDTGRLLWSKTQAMTVNRVSAALFVDDRGSVAFDSLQKPGLIALDGSVLDTGYVPAGPVLHGLRDFLPLRFWCAEQASSWLRVDTMQFADSPPDFIVAGLPLRAVVEGERIAFVATVDAYPENDALSFGAKTVARIPLPAGCRGLENTDVAATLSPQHEILECWSYTEDSGRATTALFVVDLRARAARRIRPPAADPSGGAPETRFRDVSATVRADGSVVATVWDFCSTEVYASAPGPSWKRSSVTPVFGPPVEPIPLCGHVALEPTTMPWGMGCGGPRGSLDPRDVTYVEQTDGTWLTLPYRVNGGHRPQDCSSDGALVAFVRSGSLVVARFDRDALHVIQPNFGRAPFGWLP
jgi:hypothetical protein